MCRLGEVEANILASTTRTPRPPPGFFFPDQGRRMSRPEQSVQIKFRNYTEAQVLEALRLLPLPIVVVKHTWSYRKKKEVEHHFHIWVRTTKPLTKETFNDTILKPRLPKLDGRHGEYSTTDPRSFKSAIEYFTCDMAGNKKKGMTLVYSDRLSEEEQRFLDKCMEATELFIPSNDLVFASKPEVSGVIHVKPSRGTTKDKQQKFYLHCKDYYDEFPDEAITLAKVAGLLQQYWTKVGFSTAASIDAYVQYAVFNLCADRGDTQSTERFRDEWVQRYLNYVNTSLGSKIHHV